MTKNGPHEFDKQTCVSVERKRHFIFILLPGYSDMNVAIATEALSEANAAGALSPYSWTIHTETGQPVQSASQLEMKVDGGLVPVGKDATVAICGGNRLVAQPSEVLINWLRRAARHGAKIAAFGSGCKVMARTGLVSDQSVAAHWAIAGSLKEDDPETNFVSSVYEIDGARLTCAGGIATSDFIIALIANHQGADCANTTAAMMNCASLRDSQSAQTMSAACQIGRRNEFLVSAVEIMTNNIEYPLSPSEIASEVGISCRQLERLFSGYLGMSPKKYYISLRLEHARRLLQQTKMSVFDVAMATGFSTAANFSKLFRKRYHVPPSMEKGIPHSIFL